MLTPADEKYDIEPDPRMHRFFSVMMLMYGDPDKGRWIEQNAFNFYREYEQWACPGWPSGPLALLQYIVWYDREKARVDGRQKTGP